MSLEFTVDGLSMKQTDELLVADEDGDDWRCYAHQKRARDLWMGRGEYADAPDSYMALNHAPTGAGKTISWADPAFRTQENVLAMYPTKALINDQFDSLKEIFEDKYNANVNLPADDPDFDSDKTSVGFAKFTSDEFERYRKELDNTSRKNGELFANIIRRLDKQNDVVIILTNPDIFSYVRHDVYHGGLARRVSGMFNALVVDEFHHADVKGQHSLVFLLEQMRREGAHKSETQKCMLLSATPEPEIQRKLESMSAPFFDLNEEGDSEPQTEVYSDDDWRTVLPPVFLRLRRADTFKAGDKLIANDNAEATRAFCGREKRTVIILDSLDEVERVAGRLERQGWLGDSHLIQTLHGQTKNVGEKIRKFNNSEAAVLVTNSAGEIGIDYEADQLIFSGSNPFTLLQRFGRLRNRTDEVDAIAYVPNRAYERFKSHNLDEHDVVTRAEFESLVEEGYEKSRKPRSFSPSFGAHEAYMQVKSIAEGSGPEEREEIEEEGIGMIENQFFEPYGLEFDRAKFMKRHNEMGDVLESLKDFRSSSPTALVYNTQDDKVYTYNIEPLLRTGKIDVVSENEFFGRTPEEHHEEARKLAGHAHGYIIWEGNELREVAKSNDDSPQPRDVSVIGGSGINDMLSEKVETRIPRRAKFFQYVVESNDLSPVDVGPINTELQESDESPLVYAVEGEKYTIKNALGLDDFFFLSTLANPSDSVCLALSHEAMYLYCIKQENIYKNDPTKNLRVHIPKSLKAEVIEGISMDDTDTDDSETTDTETVETPTA